MSGGALPVVGYPWLPTTRFTVTPATRPRRHRAQTRRKRPVVLMSPHYVELDDAHEQAALGALADLLAPCLKRPTTGEEECA